MSESEPSDDASFSDKWGRHSGKALRNTSSIPFFTTMANGSTRLGLSVASGIARRHGGDLVLQPRQSGALFCLWPPLNGNHMSLGEGGNVESQGPQLI